MSDNPLAPQPIPITSNSGVTLTGEQINKLLSSVKKVSVPPLPPREQEIILRNRLELLRTEHVFVPGQIVQWKQGLKNRIRPEYGHPAVVIEVLQTPIVDRAEKSSSTYFQEPLDLILGVLIPEDNGFITYYFDRRRFEPFAG